MDFTKRLRSAFSYKPKGNYKSDISDPMLINVKLLKEHNVNCPCKSIAIPIGIKGNKYQCIKCEKQLLGMSYNFGDRDITDQSSNTLPKNANQLIDMTYYDDSVNFLKNE
ncbi:hypothetical protein KPY62_07865 [Psychrobacter sp. TAE2020]|uniref:hypothetical protein n=1 Tax=Psychrobacter sp. TAE2020 TaxID=2846762 RepID=UPI001C111EFB|nr:hypothetical protein [Psychrobacter sp. TAE2020]MBU5617004.1 hypothetical protein [Psychrobacter sp. TAE2020]